MKNQPPARVEKAFARALEVPVPPGLVDGIRRAAHRQTVVRAWRRRAAWVFAPLAAAAAAALFFTIPRPSADVTPERRLARPASFHRHAQTLVSLAAGGNEYHEEADVHSLAQDLLSLQGFY